MTETRAPYNTGEHRGELKLCPEGQRLFDEYVRQVEKMWDEKKLINALTKDKAWKKYEEHRKVCKECGYV